MFKGTVVSDNWPTQQKDLLIAERIMETYANELNSDALGLFELVFDAPNKQLDFKLAGWVFAMATQFKSMYGEDQGEFVTRLVVSYCMTKGQTIH